MSVKSLMFTSLAVVAGLIAYDKFFKRMVG